MAHHSTLNEQSQFEINHANELISEGQFYHATGKENDSSMDVKKIAKEEEAKSNETSSVNDMSADKIFEKLHEITLADEAAASEQDKTVFDTVAWLKAHEQSNKVHGRFVGFFENAIEKIHSKKVAVPAEDGEAVLPTSWGKDKWHWNEVSFGVLNAPFRVKISKIREILYNKQLESEIKEHELVNLVKFMQFFDNQLDEANRLKSEVLLQRSKIFGKRFIVSTAYDRYAEFLHGAVVHGLNGDLKKFKNGVLYAFLELESVMNDEEKAAMELVSEHVDSSQDEFLALSRALKTANRENVSKEEGCFYAELMVYVDQALSQVDLSALLSLWDKKVLDSLAGVWMKYYASNLALMSKLDMDPAGAELVTRSRASAKTIVANE